MERPDESDGPKTINRENEKVLGDGNRMYNWQQVAYHAQREMNSFMFGLACAMTKQYSEKTGG